jgi:hypothetical protein
MKIEESLKNRLKNMPMLSETFKTNGIVNSVLKPRNIRNRMNNASESTPRQCKTSKKRWKNFVAPRTKN